MSTRVSEVVARPTRTGVQGGIGWAITEGIDAFFYDMTDRQYGIAVILLTMLIGYTQTVSENYFGKALLRDVPEPDAPVVDTGGSNA